MLTAPSNEMDCVYAKLLKLENTLNRNVENQFANYNIIVISVIKGTGASINHVVDRCGVSLMTILL